MHFSTLLVSICSGEASCLEYSVGAKMKLNVYRYFTGDLPSSATEVGQEDDSWETASI